MQILFLTFCASFLPGCSKNSTKLSKEEYDSSVGELTKSSFTLSRVFADNIGVEDGVRTPNPEFPELYQYDYVNQYYSYTNDVEPDNPEACSCISWLPNPNEEPNSQVQGSRVYYCSKNGYGWCIVSMPYNGAKMDWFLDYSKLSYNSKNKCYTGIYFEGKDYSQTYSYYAEDGEIKEILWSSTSKNDYFNWETRWSIDEVGTTSVPIPDELKTKEK